MSKTNSSGAVKLLRGTAARDKRRARNDFLLIAAIVLGSLLLLPLCGRKGGKVQQVRLLLDGEELAIYSVEETRRIPIDTGYGHNTLLLEMGEARMVEADCPDGYCIRQSAIRKAGDTIVCLPHHLVVEGIGGSGEEESEIDAVAR